MPTWDDIIAGQQSQAYLQKLQQRVQSGRVAGEVIYPPEQDVFNAFALTEFDHVKVVILGQDPYHGPGQAHGLSFSVPAGEKIPPSLKNIYKELATEFVDFTTPSHGCLQSWAEQGVLLLNTVLTVEQGKAHSHAKLGWEQFTDHILAQLNQHREGLVFMLWGKHAQNKGQLIDQQKHHVLHAPHPSPLSAHRGFFGCGHFSKANQLLQQQGQSAICWQV